MPAARAGGFPASRAARGCMLRAVPFTREVPEMRAVVVFAVVAVATAAGPSAGQPKDMSPAAAVASVPKNGWVSAEPVGAKPWFAGEDKYRLVMTFVPDKDAAGKALPKGVVKLGFDLSKDGQAEAVIQPADSRYELLDGKAGPVLRIVRAGELPEKKNAFKKVPSRYESDNRYRLSDGKLVFPEGLTVAAWGAMPADVKQAGPVVFVAK
jgi:hypothetical protein